MPKAFTQAGGKARARATPPRRRSRRLRASGLRTLWWRILRRRQRSLEGGISACTTTECGLNILRTTKCCTQAKTGAILGACELESPIMRKYIDAFGAIPLATLPRPKPFYKGFSSTAPEAVVDRHVPFSTDPTPLEVWAKGAPIPGFDPAIWRYDICGWPIRFSDFGNRDSKFGWESDHIQPEALGGSDALHNRQPLHWENNTAKGDIYPWIG